MDSPSAIHNPQSAIHNAYTDSPDPHPNLVLGSLQLLFWLLFHPSAWRNHIACIASGLRPDFCLAELNRAHWRTSSMRRLLVRGYAILPVLIGLLVSPFLLVLGASGQNIAFGVAFGAVLSMTSGITVGAAVSVAVGIAIEVAIGIAFGLVIGVAFDVAGSVMAGVAFGVAGGVVVGAAFGIAKEETTYSLTRQAGGVIAGILVGMVLFGIVFGSLLFGMQLSLESVQESGLVSDSTGGVAGGIAASLVLCVAGGVILGIAGGLRTRDWWCGVKLGIVFGLLIGVMFGALFGLAAGVMFSLAAGAAFGIMAVSFFALLYALTERIAGPWAGAVAGTLGSGGGLLAVLVVSNSVPPWLAPFTGAVGLLVGLALGWGWRAAFYPFQAAWNLLLLRADEQRTDSSSSLLRWHTAFWDEHQRLPLLGLEEHLVLVTERNPAEGQAAIEYLVTSPQRWAAQAAQVELDARRLENCADVTAISQAHHSLVAGELVGPASALLRSFSRVSQDIDAALRQESAYNQRLALSAVEDRLDGLLRELTRSSERYAVRFRPVANQWRRIVSDRVQELAKTVELRQELDSPYIIGVPLTELQEIFVGRTDVSARIEGLLLDRRRPPLLLYGQRRMGKTSLLNNLGRLLPSTIVPLFVDLQGPASRASDHAGFLYNLARSIIDSAERQRDLVLPPLDRESLAVDPFTRFDEWLDEVETSLGQNTALLALDEFETLDRALAERRFSEAAVLGMLRHLIQHRPRFKVLLAGSHTLDELQRWASYLINVQVVHISYLKEDEARQLIEWPVKDFALRYEPDASQRVLDLSRGHPFLVQLLCAEIVALKNEQEPAIRRLACLDDVEAAVPEALSHGSFFFADIQRNQVDARGLAVLRFLAAQGEGATVSRESLARQFLNGLDKTLDLLTRRELIEAAGGGYRFQVELIRRWFVQEVG